MRVFLAAPLLVLWACVGGSDKDTTDTTDTPTTDTPVTDTPTDDTGTVTNPCDDTDGDGVCNEDDRCEGSDDGDDADSDGTPDGCDPCPDDPTDRDTDGDGVCDNADVCAGDDATGDSDSDGVCDSDDVCVGDDATGDTDSDGVCDSDDVCAGDDATGDTDNDEICDDIDPCPLDGPPGDDDDDGDGICDSDDTCFGDNASGDTDYDGVCDDSDPCPLDAPPDDDDGDGVCNSDDVCLGDDATGDSDGDGACDDVDICLGDDLSGDTDNDGVCDDTDVCPLDFYDDCFNDCVVNMDDAWAYHGDGADPDTYYAAYGLTFDNAAGYGLIGGMSNGDPGNWDIEGSNGPAAWGLWPGAHGIDFGSEVRDVSLDFLRAFTDYTFTVEAYRGGVLVDSRTVTLTGAFDTDTASFPGPLDNVSWNVNGYFGVDNVRYRSTGSCPQLNECAIGLDEAWAANGQGSNPTTYYAAYGLVFDNAAGYGLIGGMGNGDPGNWDIEGSNGSAAWGLWPGAHGIDFGSDVVGLSLDFLRAFTDYTFTVEAYRGGVLVDSRAVALTGAFGRDTITFSGVVDEVRWNVNGYFGVDNIRYRSANSCPSEAVRCVLNMDDAWAVTGQGSSPTDYYGTYGMTFDNAAGYGLIGGVGNGDPGNWDIEGSNGSAAWGLWPGAHGIDFVSSVHGLSLDFLRAFTDYTFTVEAYNEGILVGRAGVSLVGAYDIESVYFPGPVDEVRWNVNGYFGVDNVQFDGTCPL